MHSNHDDVIPGIKCTVTNCVYNESRKCVAGQIEVGTSDASSVEETDCLTFESKN